MFSTDFTATSGNFKNYLNKVEPDGIFRGLKLVSWKVEDNFINFEFIQPSSGLYRNEKLYAPRETDSEKRTEIVLSRIVEMCSAVTKPVLNDLGQDVRFGASLGSVNTFREFCAFYTANIDLENVPLVDTKVLYVKNEVAKDSKYGFPTAILGDSPFVTSEFKPAFLSAKRDLEHATHPKFVTFTVVEIQDLLADVVDTSVPTTSNTEELGF